VYRIWIYSPQLALIIGQHRDKNHRLSGIKLSALRYGLEKVHKKAKEMTGQYLIILHTIIQLCNNTQGR